MRAQDERDKYQTLYSLQKESAAADRLSAHQARLDLDHECGQHRQTLDKLLEANRRGQEALDTSRARSHLIMIYGKQRDSLDDICARTHGLLCKTVSALCEAVDALDSAGDPKALDLHARFMALTDERNALPQLPPASSYLRPEDDRYRVYTGARVCIRCHRDVDLFAETEGYSYKDNCYWCRACELKDREENGSPDLADEPEQEESR